MCYFYLLFINSIYICGNIGIFNITILFGEKFLSTIFNNGKIGTFNIIGISSEFCEFCELGELGELGEFCDKFNLSG